MGEKLKEKPTSAVKGKRRPLTGMTENDRAAERMSTKRAEARDLEIPKPVNPKRRKAALADVLLFGKTYAADLLRDPYTDIQKEIARAILHAATEGGDQAIAAPRGEGKTTLCIVVLVFCLLKGLIRYLVLVGATQKDGNRLLRNIKRFIERNELLAQDFPEVCVPIRALGGANQMANKQTVGGERTRTKWQDEWVVLPTVKGSAASGAIIMSFGLESSIRGLNEGGDRPELVWVDDPDTRESAKSDKQTAMREETIDGDLAGLGGPSGKCGRLMTTTIMSETSVSGRYTNPKIKPSWRPRRFKQLIEKPICDRVIVDEHGRESDIEGQVYHWRIYIAMRQRGQETLQDIDGREAFRYCKAHFQEMHEGAYLANPHRYNKALHADGDPVELSALQKCYNIIADRGWKFFSTEYQNEEPQEDKPLDNGITAEVVRSRFNSRPRGIVPSDIAAFVGGIDVGQYALHYTMGAWVTPAQGWIVDYGVEDVHNAKMIGPEKAILNALRTWRDRMREAPCVDEDGVVCEPTIILVDSGHWQDVIFEFVRESGDPFRASKGFGRGRGMQPFAMPVQTAKDKIAGEHWFAHLQGDIWQIGLDADHWKRWVQQRFLVPTDVVGSLSLFGDDAREHTTFSQHIVAEIEKDEFVPGFGIKRYFHVANRNNHWLDATYMMAAAAGMMGIRLLPRYEPPPPDNSFRSDERGGLSTPDGRPYLITER